MYQLFLEDKNYKIQKAAKKLGWLSSFLNQEVNPDFQALLWGRRQFVGINLKRFNLALKPLPQIEIINLAAKDLSFRAFCAEGKVFTSAPIEKEFVLKDDWIDADKFITGFVANFQEAMVIDYARAESNWYIINLIEPSMSEMIYCDPIEALKTIPKSYEND
jgi:hypothetical protein